jgi:hypothetical protein
VQIVGFIICIKCKCLSVLKAVPWMRRLVVCHLSLEDQVRFETRPCETVRKGKVKYTLVQALRLCTGRTAHRGSRDIALLFLDHGTRRGGG